MLTSVDEPSSFQKLRDQVKCDILSKTYAADNVATRKQITRTFISDTVTVPSEEMYTYAALATLGDDVYSEPSTNALETHVAQLLGKEAALFMSSGTQSNQISLRTHLKQPPYSVICDKRAHINNYEAGGAAFHSGAHVVPLIPANGHYLTLEEAKDNIVTGTRTSSAPTEVISLENTLDGIIFPQHEIIKICGYARSIGIKTHLDGARIWHAAAETRTSLNELCEPFDSISVCFSKGLGAPIGSCLVGSNEFITKARWLRRLFGGGMRQTGFLAGCAAYALTHNLSQLPRVHALARRLETELEKLGAIILNRAETCMVYYDPSPLGLTFEEIAQGASTLSEPLFLSGSRLVVHIQTSERAVDDLTTLIRTLAEEKKGCH